MLHSQIEFIHYTEKHMDSKCGLTIALYCSDSYYMQLLC